MKITKKVEQEVTINITNDGKCCAHSCKYADSDSWGRYICAYFDCPLNSWGEPWCVRCQQCINEFGDGKAEWVTLEEFLKTDLHWVVLEKKNENLVVFVRDATHIYWINSEFNSMGECCLPAWKNELVRPFPEGEKVTVSFQNGSPR